MFEEFWRTVRGQLIIICWLLLLGLQTMWIGTLCFVLWSFGCNCIDCLRMPTQKRLLKQSGTLIPTVFRSNCGKGIMSRIKFSGCVSKLIFRVLFAELCVSWLKMKVNLQGSSYMGVYQRIASNVVELPTTNRIVHEDQREHLLLSIHRMSLRLEAPHPSTRLKWASQLHDLGNHIREWVPIPPSLQLHFHQLTLEVLVGPFCTWTTNLMPHSSLP